MRWLIVFLGLLAACDTPSPGFRGIAPTRVTVAPSVFDVRVRGNMAEAIRLNAEYAPRMGPIGPRALIAIEQASGCRVSKLGGDQAMITARLACGAGRAAPPVPPSYNCDVLTRPATGGANARIEEVICDPV